MSVKDERAIASTQPELPYSNLCPSDYPVGTYALDTNGGLWTRGYSSMGGCIWYCISELGPRIFDFLLGHAIAPEEVDLVITIKDRVPDEEEET